MRMAVEFYDVYHVSGVAVSCPRSEGHVVEELEASTRYGGRIAREF